MVRIIDKLSFAKNLNTLFDTLRAFSKYPDKVRTITNVQENAAHILGIGVRTIQALRNSNPHATQGRSIRVGVLWGIVFIGLYKCKSLEWAIDILSATSLPISEEPGRNTLHKGLKLARVDIEALYEFFGSPPGQVVQTSKHGVQELNDSQINHVLDRYYQDILLTKQISPLLTSITSEVKVSIAVNLCRNVHGAQDVKVIYKTGEGTDGKTLILITSSTNAYAVMFAEQPRVPFVTQRSNAQKLQRYMREHIPEFYKETKIDNCEVMVYQSIGRTSLHQLIKSGDEPLNVVFRLWEDIVLTFARMYKQSATYPYEPTNCVRNHQIRLSKVRDFLSDYRIHQKKGYMCDTWQQYPLIINGEKYPPIEDLLPQLEKIAPPLFGVTCHGDPHPANIIISDDLQKWGLVDFEWTGHNHDFRWMYSHLYGWWPVKYSRLENTPEMVLHGREVHIHYHIKPDQLLRRFQICVKNAFQASSGISLSDQTAVNQYLVMLYFREMAYISDTKRSQWQIPMFGEAVKLLTRLEMPDDAEFSLKVI